MSVQRVGFAVGIVLLLLAGWVGSGFLGAQQGDKGPAGGDFDGKYLYVIHQGTAYYLEKVQVKKLADKHFLVGTGIDSEEKDDWTKGRQVWLPVDGVPITVYPSQAALMKALKVGASKPGE